MSSFNLADVFIAMGAHYGDRPALVSGERQLSYAQLSVSAAQLGHALAGEGIRPGENVGLALRDGLDVIVYMIALWMIDAVPVVIDFRSPTAERVTLAEEFDFVTIASDNTPPNAPYESIRVSDEWREQVTRYPSTPPISMRDGGHLATISLTSGTTGRPLGLLIRHEDTLKRVAQMGRPPTGSGRALVVTPMHFNASRTGTITRLFQGWTVVIHPPLFTPQEIADTIMLLEIESAHFVPTIIRGLLSLAGDRSSPVFPHMSHLSSGGAPTSPEEKKAAKRLLSAHYSEGYGSSLCGNISRLASEDIESHADTVGKVNPMARLEVVDGNDNLVALGQAGLIRVRTPAMVTATYKDRTRPHGDRLKDGWVYPGDIGALDADGYLRILGRSTDVIIRGGANVHPSEIESVMAEHPQVAQVAVVGYAAEREGEEIAAFVVARGEISEADITAYARTRLAPDKRPRRIVLIDQLPQTSVGKLDRRALRARLQ